MAAIQGTRISPSVTGAFIVSVAAALLVGGAGGYVIRSVGSQGSAGPAQAVQNQAVQAPELPASVQAYMAPAQERQFKVDEFIRALGYAKPAELPAWVQAYTAPAEEPQFKVDEFIRSLNNADASGRASDLTSIGNPVPEATTGDREKA
jgi:cell division protein FtsN